MARLRHVEQVTRTTEPAGVWIYGRGKESAAEWTWGPELTPEQIAAHRASLEARWAAGAKNAKQLLEETGGVLKAPPGAEAQLQALLEWAAEAVAAIRAAPKGTHSANKLELAAWCERAAVQVRMYLGHTAPDAAASAAFMAAADELGRACASLEASKWEHVVVRTREGGRAGALKRHARERATIQERNERMGADARKLAALNYSRDDILARLAKRYPVKASTAEKIPQVNKWLPRKRRKPSP